MPVYYDLTLGALSFITLNNTITETFGNVLTNVGSGTVPAEREPYRYENLTVPCYGHFEEANPYDVGLQKRREARAMFRNRQLLTDGFYMDFAKDPEFSAWISVGNASLEYLDGGVSLADFQLNLGQVHLIATPAVAQDGVFVNTQNLGDPTVANDILRTSYTELTQGSFLLTEEGAPRVYLGVGAYDIKGKVNGVPLTIGSYAGINGTGYYVDELQHGNTLSFEISPTDRRGADVIISDRRGITSPTYTLAGDRNPNLYGWDKVFGPDYPHTTGDVPVIQNDRCRLLYTSGSSFQVQTSTGAAFANNGTLSLGMDSLTKVSVPEWRPYRGVIRANFVAGGGMRATAFIILQRGWAGPQVEVYAQNSSGAPVTTTITYSGSLAQHTNEADRWQFLRLGAADSEITWKTVSQDVIVSR